MRWPLVALLVQPVLAGLLLLLLHRWKPANLVRILMGSGLLGAVLTALIVFLRSSVPIAPYELSKDAWDPVYRQILLSLYVGFGLGIFIPVFFVLPIHWIRKWAG
ncbi:MAG: hypothetical protein ACK2T2_01680 [Anaerolineales bacterium]|jgi:hypothetical protein